MTAPNPPRSSSPHFDPRRRAGLARRRAARQRQVLLESLEPRTLLSTLPEPTVLSRADVSNSGGNESSPSITVDPNDPLRVVSVWTRLDPTDPTLSAKGTPVVAEGAYSTDGGQTWAKFAMPPVLADPNLGPPTPGTPYAQTTDTSVAFDRNHAFYVVSSEHDAKNISGAIVLQKYDFSGASPALTLGNKVVHQWVNDQAYAPTIAVDTGVGNAATDLPAGTPAGVVVGPDGKLYVSDSDTSQVQQFNGSSGTFQGVFASGAGLYQPSDLTFDPTTGNLFIANRQTGNVLQVDGQTGATRGVFTASLVSVKAPGDEVIGPDGNLYVSSRDTNSVLKFNAATGGFLGTFVAAGSGGLAQPEGMVFGVDGKLYVASSGSKQILRYDATTGAFLDIFFDDTKNANTIQFGGLAFGLDGNLYAVETTVTGPTGNPSQVLRINRNTGALIGAFTGGMPLFNATSLAFSPIDGNLLVDNYDDTANPPVSSVLRFSGTTGQFISVFVSSGTTQANTLSRPAGLVFRPDRTLIVGSAGSDAVLQYNATTGVFQRALVPSGSGGLDGTSGLAFNDAGDIYVSSRNTNQVLRYAAGTGDFVRTITPEPLKAPRDSTLSLDGKTLYVASRDTDSIYKYDAMTGQFLGVFVPSGSGGLNLPEGLAFNPTDGNLYVGSGFDSRILKYDGQTGAYLGQLVAAGSGGLDGPEGLVFRNGKLYVTSSKTNSVLTFNAQTGAFIATFTPEPLRAPEDAILGPDGKLYVASRDGNEVLRYDGTTGAFLDIFVPAKSGGLLQPRGLQFDGDGDLLVSSYGTDQVLKYRKSDGAFLGTFTPEPLKGPTFATLGPDGNLYVSNTGLNEVVKYDGTTGAYLSVFVAPGASTLQAPTGLAFGPDANNDGVPDLYVSSNGSNEVLRYDGVTGALIGSFVASGGLLSLPEGLIFDASNNLYVGNLNTDEVLEYRPDGTFFRSFVTAGSGGLNGPEGLAFGPDGSFYVASDNTNQVLKYNGTDGKFSGVFLNASASVPLDGPAGIAFGREGNLYVSSKNNNRILRFDATNGNYRNTFVPNGQGGLASPNGLLFSAAGDLLAVSQGSDRVIRFDAAPGQSLGTFVGAAGNLNAPAGMTLGPDLNLYVASAGSNEVRRFSGLTGAAIGSGVFVAAGAGGLVAPKDVAFGTGGDLFVTSSGTNQVLRYDGATGTFKSIFVDTPAGNLSSPTGLVFGPGGDLYVASSSDGAVYRYNGTTGALIGAFVAAGSGGLSGPAALRFGPDGNLYVVGSGGKVLEYNGVTGAFLRTFATGLNAPAGLAFGTDGSLYVTDASGNRVVRLNGSTGAAVENFVTAGLGGLSQPAGVLFNRDGSLLVASAGNNQVLRYTGASGAYVSDFTPEPLRAPTGLTKGGPSNDIFVASGTTSQVFRYSDPSGQVHGSALGVFTPRQLSNPQDIDRDAAGNYYVTSQATNEVFQYNAFGQFVKVFVTKGSGGLSQPGALAFNNGYLYVASKGTNQVLFYNGTTGAFLGVVVDNNANGPTNPSGLLFDGAGNILVSSAGTNEILRYNALTGAPNPSGTNPRAVFVVAAANGLSAPTGLTFGPGGNLYVSSSGSNQVLSYNPTTGAGVGVFVAANQGGLSTPGRLTFGADGNLYVVSTGSGQVMRYNGTTGASLPSTGNPGAVFVPAGNAVNAGGMIFGAGGLLLVSSGTNVVQLYSATDGSFVGPFTPEPIRQAEDVIFNPAGNLLVSSALGNEVLRYGGTSGAYLGVFVAPGSGGLTFPQSLLYGPDGALYISSQASNSVLRFDGTTGAFLNPFVYPGSGGLAAPQGLAFLADGSLIVSSRDSDAVLRFNGSDGSYAGSYTPEGLKAPVGLQFDAGGDLYVASSGRDEVLRYDGTTGRFKSIFTSDSLKAPEGAVLGPDGNLYVASSQTNEILRYDGTTGAFLNVFVAKGSGGLNQPEGLTFSPDNTTLYVTSKGSNQVLRYRANNGQFLGVFIDTNGGLLAPEGLAFGADNNLYVASSGTNSVRKYKGSSGIFQGTFTTGTTPTAPIGLQFGPDGNLYVASSGTNQVLQYNGTTGAFLKAYVTAGSGGLATPAGLQFGPDGSLYVVSSANNEVIRYSGATGSFLDVFVTSGRGGLATPTFLAFRPDGSLLVSSKDTDQLLLYDTNGAYLSAFTPGALRQPEQVAFGPDGNLYVSSYQTSQVLQYKAGTGQLLSNYVKAGSGNLVGPEGLVFAPDGKLLVSSLGTDTILRYGAGGTFLDSFSPTRPLAPTNETIGPDGYLYVSSRDSDSILRYDPASGKLLGTFVAPGAGKLKQPAGLAFGADGNLYVASGQTNQVLRYDGKTGTFIDIFVAANLGGLSLPQGLTFGPDGNLYVASFNSGTILKYNGTSGAFLGTFVLANPQQLSGPTGLAFGPDGNLYVASFNNDTVDRYRGSNGQFIDAFVPRGTAGLDGPVALRFDSGGNLYVASDAATASFLNQYVSSNSSQDNRVLKFGPTGTFLGAFVDRGSGGLDGPAGLAFGANGDLFVTSRDTNQVLRYSSSGAFVQALDNTPNLGGVTFGPDANGDGVPDLYASSTDTDAVLRFDGRTGGYIDTFVRARLGGLSGPGVLRFGPNGDLYVASTKTNQVLEFRRSDGAFVGVAASGFGLSQPSGLAFDAAGKLYVSSQGTNSVIEFDPNSGLALANFVTPGSGGLSAPAGLAFLADGSLVVASAGTKQVLRFNGQTGAPLGAFTQAAGPAFTDPTTGKAQNDKYSNNLYIAWATNELGDGKHPNPDAIVIVGSSDGGSSFSPRTVVNDKGYSDLFERDERPRLAISQGTIDGKTAPGTVSIIWDDFGTGALLVPARDFLHSDQVTPVVGASSSQSFDDKDANGFIGTNSAATQPVTTRFQVPVNISDPRFTTVSKVTVNLNVVHPDLTMLSIDLIAPDGTRVPLLRQGDVTGANLGLLYGDRTDTVFDQDAPRSIIDGTLAAPYVGYFRPDSIPANNGVTPRIPAGPDLRAFNGLSRDRINGFWTLEITDYSLKDDPFPAQRLRHWSVNIDSGLQAGVDGNVGTTYVTGSLNGPDITMYGKPYGISPASPPATFTATDPFGIGPGPVIASDNTLGSFSAHQGRLYASFVQDDPNLNYNAGGFPDNTDISLVYSDDGGRTWSSEITVNDDNALTDGYTESYNSKSFKLGRAQYQPSVAVDPTTGQVALSFYDARNDASRARVATYIAVSSDGGQTFAPETFANTPNTVFDAIARKDVVLGPIPDNQSPRSNNPLLGNALTEDKFFSYGDHQDLAFLDGRLYPAWSGNENGGNNGTNLLDIRVASAVTAAGPRVLTSTMGAIKATTVHDLMGNALTFNNTNAADGAPIADGFVVTFDRAIDATTISPANVHVLYRDVNTSGFSAGTELAVGSVTALSEGNTPQGPTQFLVRFAGTGATGTYSYTVGPDVRDRSRSVINGVLRTGNLMDQNANGTTGEDPAAAPYVGLTPGDVYAVPKPAPLSPVTFTGRSFQPPYDTTTQPLIVPGPHIVRTYVPGAPATADNLVTDQVITQLAVVFDRDMDPSTLTGQGTVERMVGPSGEITGPFTVTHDPTEDPSHPRTFLIGFPAQQLSGTYSLSLSASAKSKAGEPLDTNQNAGLNTLRGDPSQGTTTVTFPSTDPTPPVIGGATANSVARSKILVPQSFLVQGLTVTVNITYPNDPDLTATLIAPDGTSVQLFTNVGATGTGMNFTSTTFDDAATTPIQNGGPPFFGSFNPRFPLSAFKNHIAAGFWTLQIVDKKANVFGTIDSWSMNMVKPISGTGLGEPVADQATASFRIFTMDPTNPLASNTWTAVGPAGIGAKGAGLNAEVSGRVGGLAVDPSDPSGNTVYVGAASGGVWKTTDFLTTSPAGPTYVPLTDFGPTFGLNIGGLAIFGRNSDPGQSIVFAGTGEGDTLGVTPPGTPTRGDSPLLTTRGIGFLRSTDGGSSWALLDSTVNFDASGNPLPMNSPLRDHIFVGTATFKVAVDPTPTPTGDVIVYAALADVDANGQPVAGNGRAGGIWRSVDSGKTWQRMRAGQATDVILDLASGTGAPGGNVQIIYGAFRDDGIYSSPNRGQVWNLMAGLTGDPLIQAAGNPPSPLGVLLPASEFAKVGTPTSSTQNGMHSRITLARPALTGNPLEDTLYQGWLYAAVVSADSIITADNQVVYGGHLDGLYLTKDFGQNWTRVRMPVAGPAPSNDERWGDVGPLGVATPYGVPIPHPPDVDNFGLGNYNLSLAVDPNNPNVVYLGGTNEYSSTGMLRVDTTGISDPHSFYITNTDPEGTLAGLTADVDASGGERRVYPNDPINPRNPQHSGVTGPYGPSSPPASQSDPFNPVYNQYLNLIANPLQPFLLGSTILVTNSEFFPNTGADTKWIPFDQALKPDPFNNDSKDPWSLPTRGQHELITLKDPTTGKTRLIFGDDQGVFTAVDQGDGTLLGSLGSVAQLNTPNGDVKVVNGSRNGNLQTAQFFYGAAQPSNLAAQASQLQGMFYATSKDTGTPNSNPNVISTGQVGYGNISWSRPGVARATGGGIDVVQTGPSDASFGAVYRFLWPGEVDNGVATDFLQRDQTSRTFNLVQTTAGQPDPVAGVNIGDSPDPQWPFRMAFNFAVNPLAGDQAILSSYTGRVFSTENQGKFWNVIGQPAALDGSNAQALVYGAPDPNGPGGVGNLDNFLYAGTVSGNIFVTFTGGGTTGNAWTRISNGLDGSAIQAIVTNPTRGSHEAYAVTKAGVYYMADSSKANARWVNITGNVFSLNEPLYGNPALVQARGKTLTAIQADWRYLIPDDPTNPTGPTHPILYAAGDGGVFRSIDKGQNWSLFPSVDTTSLLTTPQPPGDGGGLPNALVTDLDLSLGQINPTTGRPDVSTGPNVLLATTYGRGSFTIRLAPLVFANSVMLDPGLPAPGGSDSGPSGTDLITNVVQPVIDGLSAQTAFGQVVTINLLDLADPAHPVVIGTGTTDASGRFRIQVNSGVYKSDGTTDGKKAVGIQATDQSGTKGNIVSFSFTLDTTAPAAPSTPRLQPGSDSGPSNTDNYTNVTKPALDVTQAEPDATVVLLRKKQGQPDTAYVVVGSLIGPGTFREANTLADGIYIYAAQQTDVAGNGSPFSPLLTVTIDTIPPATPIAPDLQDGSDTGVSNTDNVTADTSPIFNVTATEPTATVQLLRKLASAPITSYVIVGTRQGSGPAADPGPLADGVYTYAERQVDQAGNIGPIGATLTVTIDTTASGASSQPDLQAGSDSGASNTDNVTNVTSPTFDVVVAEGTSTVQLLRKLATDPASAYVVVATRTGPGSLRDAGPLAEGVYTYASRQVDLAGGVGPISTTLTVTIDTTPPAAASVPDLEDASDTGASSTDNITNVVRPTFDVGGAEATATVQLLRKASGATVGSYVVVATVTGPGTVQDAGPLADGAYDYASRQVDLAGNMGPISASLTVTIDATPPAAPIAPDLQPGSDSGPSTTDNNTSVTGPVFDVVAAEPGGTMQLLRKLATAPTGSYVVVGTRQGTGSIVDAGPVADGAYTYATRQVDVAGNLGALSPALTVTIDTTPPAAPAAPDLQDASDSGPSNTDNITNVTRPTFDLAGVEPGATVVLYRNGVAVGSRTGPGAVTDAGPVPDGTYTYTAQQTDAAGNLGPMGPGLSVTIDTVAAAPGTPDLQDASDTGTSSTDNITNATSPAFDVIPAEVGATVRLLRDGVVVASRTGPGAITDPGPVAAGTHTYTAQQLDQAGNLSAVSGSLPVTIITATPTTPSAPDLQAGSDTGTSNTDNVSSATTLIFDITVADANKVVQLLRNGVVVASRVGPGSITDAGPVQPDGVYTYTARQVDIAGNQSAASAGLAVTVDTTAPAAPSAPGLIASSDTGASSSDGVTKLQALTFSVPTAEAGATVRLFRDGVQVATRTGPGNITDPGPVPEGAHAYTAQQVDLAGNVGPISGAAGVTVDVTPPAASGAPDLLDASDSGPSSTDNITSVALAGLPTFRVTPAEADATVQLLRNGAVVATIIGPGTIADPGPTLLDGVYTYTSRQVDLAGNAGPVSAAITVTIDSTPPAQTAAPDLQPGSDTGPSNNDNITNVTNPTFDVAPTEAGATVQLLRDNAVVASAVATGSTLSLQDPGPVPAGGHIYTARQVDTAGNAGPISGGLIVTILTNGTTFVPGTPDLQSASDSGALRTDNVTSNTRPTFDVSPVENGATVQLLRRVSGVPSSSYVVVASRVGPGAMQDPGPLADGMYDFAAREVDSAGNPGAASAPLTVTIDTSVTAPAAPRLQPGSDSGSSNTDGITNVTSPTFDVTGVEVGARVQLLRNGAVIATLNSAPSSTAALQDPGPVADGTYTYTARQTDLAGNVSTLSGAQSVTIRTVKPGAVGAPSLQPGSDTGLSNSDRITAATSPVFNVAGADPTLTVQLLRNGQVVGSRTGPGAVTDAGPVPDGTYNYTARQVDVAGNAGPVSAGLTVTIDATAPAAPSAPVLQPGSDTGASNSDGVTKATVPVFNVAAAEGQARVQLLRNGAVVATITGPGALTDPGPLTDGTYAYTSVQIDLAGNVSPASAATSITVDTVRPTVSNLALLPADDSGTPGDGITNVNRPHLTGTAEPGATVELLSGSTVLGSTTADASGNFTLQPTGSLADGSYSLVARASDLAGNTATSATPLSLTIATNGTTVPTLVLLAADDSGAKGDNTTNVRRPRFTGKAGANATVQLVEGATVLASTTADGLGNFTIQPTANVPEGTHNLQASAVVGSGNASLSAVLPLKVDLTPPAAASGLGMVSADDTGVQGDGVTANRRPRIGGTAEPGATVELLDSKGVVLGSTIAAASGGAFSVRPTAVLPVGVNTLSVRVTDPAGNVGTSAAAPPLDVILVAGDYDGDGKADLSSVTPSSFNWTITLSGGGTRAVQFGTTGDVPRLADYDGDGKADLALYRPSTAQAISALSGGGALIQPFGAVNTDLPIEGDFDGDGKTDVAVFRPSTAQWFIISSKTGNPSVTQFGQGGVDRPIPADFDGDGKTDLAVFRPTTDQWLILYSGGGSKVLQFGQPNVDAPIPADFDGDHKADLAVFRPTTSQWLILYSGGGSKVLQFGQPNLDVPVPLDYDGDGKADLSVYRPTTSQWITLLSSGGSQIVTSGRPYDIPVPAPYAYRTPKIIGGGGGGPGAPGAGNAPPSGPGGSAGLRFFGTSNGGRATTSVAPPAARPKVVVNDAGPDGSLDDFDAALDALGGRRDD